jgi:hypothetical protein
MTQLTLRDPANTPLADFDMALAERLVSEVLGGTLRELFPVVNSPVNWEPLPVLFAVNALLLRLRDIPLSTPNSFPGLFGLEPRPQDIYTRKHADITEEEWEKIQWQQGYTHQDEPWVRFSFEAPLPAAPASATPGTTSTPDPRITQLEQELTSLQGFLQTAMNHPDSNLTVTTMPTTPTAPEPIPTLKPSSMLEPTIGKTASAPVTEPAPIPDTITTESAPVPEPVPGNEETSTTTSEPVPTEVPTTEPEPTPAPASEDQAPTA